MELETTIRIIVKFFLYGLSFTGAICMFYCFAGVFTKKRLVKIIFVVIVSSVFLLGYIENRRHPDAIIMEEDRLYIKPKSDIK